MSIRSNSKFDIVIVGGGTAGTVLANTLSSVADWQVLPLEAGPDFPTQDQRPTVLRQGHSPVTSGYNWNLQAARRAAAPIPGVAHLQRSAGIFAAAAKILPQLGTVAQPVGDAEDMLHYPVGKVIGGSSAVNGALAMHARPADYDDWAKLGNDGWAWEYIAPQIARLANSSPASRGLNIETPAPAAYTQLQRAFFEACSALRTQDADDKRLAEADICAIPKNTVQGDRVCAAAMYLDPVRSRPNLEVWSGCHVDKLLFDPLGKQATGVDFLHEGVKQTVHARHVVLAAGAIHSPAILLRSGVGPSAQLERLNIKTIVDLPGVGQNLADHPVVSVWGTARPETAVPGEAVHQLMLEQRPTAADPCGAQLLMLSAVPTAMFPPLDELVAAEMACGISVVLPKPHSLGKVELASSAPFKPPRVVLNLLHDRRDQLRMMEGVRLAWKVLQQQQLQSTGFAPALWTQDIVDADALLNAFVKRSARAAWHAVGTLRMGPESDVLAVVDQFGALRGMSNVTVADASIIPLIPSVPTNLTCMVIAHRVADAMCERLKRRDAA